MAADFDWTSFSDAQFSTPEGVEKEETFSWDSFDDAIGTERAKPSKFAGGAVDWLMGRAEQRPIGTAIEKEGVGFVPRQIAAGVTDVGALLEKVGDPRQLLNILREEQIPVPEGFFEKASKALKGPQEELTEEEKAAGEELGTVGQLLLDPIISKALGGLGVARKAAKAKKPPAFIPSKAQAKQAKFLKSKGFSPEEMTILSQSPRKLETFSKFASKTDKIADRVRSTKARIGSLVEDIREKGKALPGLSGKKYDKFTNSMEKILEDIPYDFRKLLSDDVAHLQSSPHKAGDLIDFYRAINRKIGKVQGGKAVLGRLKDPTLEGLSMIKPSLGKEFTQSNKLFQDVYKFAKKMTPNQLGEIFDAAEMIGVGKGLMEGKLGLVGKTLGAIGARSLSREILTNPKLQSLHKRLAFHVKEGNTKGIERVTAQILSKVLREKPEMIEEWDIEEWKE